MTRVLPIILCFFMLLLGSDSFAADLYPFQSVQKQQQFMRLSNELRCLVCQNESLAASQAALAIQLRHQVYRMVKAGKTDQQIKDYMAARYGDFVLFKPPVMRSTYFLWFGPFILLILGAVILFIVVRRRNVKDYADKQTRLTALEKQTLEEVLEK